MKVNDSYNLSSFICGGYREGALCGECKVGYSALIILVVMAMNCSMKLRTCTCVCRVRRKDSSVTHGISTFLIICYGQYTRVSSLVFKTLSNTLSTND
jgi:hypothetical protein